MTDDEVFRKLRDAIHEDDVLADPRWEAFARGEISPEDERLLRQLAADAGHGDDVFLALRPPDDGREKRFVATALKKLKDADRAGPITNSSDPPPTQNGNNTQGSPGNGPSTAAPKISSCPRRSNFGVVRQLLAFAAVFALGLSIVPLAKLWNGDDQRYAQAGPLPDYTPEIEGSRRNQRSPSSDPVVIERFVPGGARIEILARPAQRVQGRVHAQAFLLRDGKAHRWDVPVDTSDGGVVRITGTFEQLFGSISHGRWELVLAISRDDTFPTDEDITPSSPGSNETVRILRRPIEIDPMRSDPPLATPLELATPLDVEVSGCETLLAGPICEISEPGTLRIWARSEQGALVLTLDGGQPAVPDRSVQQGQAWEISIPKGTFQLALTTPDNTQPLFLLPLRAAEPIPQVAEAYALMDEGRLTDAQRVAEELEKHLDNRTKAAALRVLAAIHWTRGNAEEAIRNYGYAADLDRSAGRLSSALKNELAVAHTYLHQGRRFSEASQAIERAEKLAKAIPVERMRLAYLKANLANESGDWRTALHQFRLVREDSERIRSDMYTASALPVEALLLQTLGREEEGEALLEKAENAAKTVSDPCIQAGAWSHLGWFYLQSRKENARAREAMLKALHIYRDACPQPSNKAQVLTDLSLFALQEGRTEEARTWLDEAQKLGKERKEDIDVSVRVQWLDIQGKIELQQGDAAKALQTYELFAALAAVTLQPIARWDAELGRARALEGLGRTIKAGAAYEHAEEMLWDRSLFVPIDEGRTGFLARRGESARSAVRFFLQRNVAKAAVIARRARARSIATLRWIDRVGMLDATTRAPWDRAITVYLAKRKKLEGGPEDYWKLPADELAKRIVVRNAQNKALLRQLDEAAALVSHWARHAPSALPPPSECELILTYYRLEKGWVGFAISQQKTTAELLGDVDSTASDDELSRTLLLPFAKALSRACQVRFLPSGSLDSIDFHKLPWRGSPLIRSLPVTYGIDVGERVDEARPDLWRIPQALVVGNPQGDLPEAEHEADAVVKALESAGWRVKRLIGRSATSAAVRTALQQDAPELFHYAGHGRFGGREGWESGLALANRSELSIGDVLALPRAPSLVVLSACEGARAQGAGAVEGLGLAHAFLSAGTRAVVASTRPVRDTLAAHLVRLLYANGNGDARSGVLALRSPDDAAERLQRASLAVMAEQPDEDWASFRVLVP